MSLDEVIFTFIDNFDDVPFKNKTGYLGIVKKRILKSDNFTPKNDMVICSISAYFEMSSYDNWKSDITSVISEVSAILQRSNEKNLALQITFFSAIFEILILKSFHLRHQNREIKKSASPVIYRMH